MPEHEIIDAEVLSETTIEETPSSDTPKKVVVDDYHKQIDFYMTLGSLLTRFGWPLMFLFGALGIAFAILAEQRESIFFRVLMIISFSVCLLALLAFILGYVFRRIALRYMRKDPNYERYLD